jgi:hypothetical protein
MFYKILDTIFYVFLLFIAFIILRSFTYEFFKQKGFMSENMTTKISDKLFKYFIKSSNGDFIWETREILNNSSINQTHNIMEVLDEKNADITIELKPRHELIDMYKDEEYYPNTKKQIWYSFTQYGTKPIRIYIDDANWIYGVEESGLSHSEYKKYVIQHEFMHALGYDHQECNENTATNGICPIMYQATKGCPEGFQCGYNITKADYTKRLY